MDLHGDQAIVPRNYSGRVYPPPKYPPRHSDEMKSPCKANNRFLQEGSSGSLHSGSTDGRVVSSQNLAPLRVDKYSTSYGSGAAPPLSPNSEKAVAKRINDLSQLESPLLRELSKRLGDLFFINTPRYDRKKLKGHPYSHHTIGERWQTIQGAHNWVGLLNPIDPVLRGEIVRYGEFAQACYDAFDADTRSKYCGSSKFTRTALLEKVGLESRGYEITNFLYSTSEVSLPSFFTNSDEGNPWSRDSNWMGFVAVCTSAEEIARLGRRDIVIAWRGTKMVIEWIQDVRDFMVPAGFDPRNQSATENVMVERGFLSMYTSSNPSSRYNKTSARQQVLKAVKRLIEKYHKDNLSITIVGHSLGSALGTLCAYDIAESGMNMTVGSFPIPSQWYDNEEHRARELNLWDSNREIEDSQSRGIRSSMLNALKDFMDCRHHSQGSSSNAETSSSSVHVVSKFDPNRIPITVYSFGGPKVGNTDFCNRMEKLGVAVLRVANVNDVVTSVPGPEVIAKPLKLIHKLVREFPSYQHVGVELQIDNRMSPHLKETSSPADTHNLEGYLHLVDGYQGPDLPFLQETHRNLALTNKTGDLLKPTYYIPPKWWQEENKGMIRDENGEWILPQRDIELFPGALTENGDWILPQQDLELFPGALTVGDPTLNSKSSQGTDFQQFFRSMAIAIERSPIK